jgi:MFS family permease
VLNIEEMIELAGEKNIYQLRMIGSFFFVFLVAAFIQMGFPIFFQPAKFACPEGVDCSEAAVCERGPPYPLSDEVRSVAYSFELVCHRRKYLTTCFEAFLYGGFIGSLYYGEVIERRGRRYAVVESLAMMVGGLVVSFLSGSAWLFSMGVFFFNAGFRGFYNASFLSIAEVTSRVMRATTPMICSIGWALGQIIIGVLSIVLISWRLIFLLTLVPLGGLLYYVYYRIEDSPRFLVTKHKFKEAKEAVAKIAMANEKRWTGCDLKEQLDYEEKMDSYERVLQGGNISSRQVHHSYASLFKYDSIRIRVIIVSLIWSLISLSYFISAKGQLNPHKSYAFNVSLAGFIEIIAYLAAILTSVNYGRVLVIKHLIAVAAAAHLCFYFVPPHDFHTGFAKVLVLLLEILIRVLMAFGNTFLAIYSIELFPTSIRHFALGMLGFITKLMYMLSFVFDSFFASRYIHPNFILGVLFLAALPLTVKLRETQEYGFKDNLSEDGSNLLMNETVAEIF